MDDIQRVARLEKALIERVGRQRYDTWFGRQTRITFKDRRLVIQVASAFLRDFIRQSFLADLQSCSADVLGSVAPVDFEIDASLLLRDPDPPSRQAAIGNGCRPRVGPEIAVTENQPDLSEPQILPLNAHQNWPSQSSDAAPRQGERLESASLEPRHAMTFDTLVAGRANQLAIRTGQWLASGVHQAPVAVFWGPTGVGKTHLLRAVRTQFRRQHPQLRAIYLTAEQFTCGFVEAVQGKGLPSFRHRCRDADLLLLDDAHFFAGKRATLEELLYTVDALSSGGKRFVLASDRPLGQLHALGAEVISRLSAGVICEISPPDFAMRVEIARRLARKMRMPLTDESLELVASQVTSGARELQGALLRLELCAVSGDQLLDLQLVQSTLGEMALQNTSPVKLADIQSAVCEVFGIEPAGLRSDGKSRALSEPRMLAMWLARKYTRAPWSEIGSFFGRRSHSTVISAHRRMQRLMSENGMVGVADKQCAVEEALRRVERALRRA
jgi:chromosomal replication initiator protein